MRILPRADMVGAMVVVGILVAGGPTSLFAQERGPSATATVRASITILEPVAVEAPSALQVLPDPRGALSVDAAPLTRSPAPVLVRTSVERTPAGPRATSPTRDEPTGDEPEAVRVTYVVSVIS